MPVAFTKLRPPSSLVSPDTVRSVIVVVARVEVPVTASVPPTVSFPVTVDVPTVELMKLELTAKILRNLLVIEPREYVLERTGIISARRLIVLKNVDSPVTASVPDALRLPVVESCEAVVVARVTVLVAVRVPVTRLVVVALAAVKSCTYAVIALKSVAKRLDEVALVRDAFSEKRLVEVALVTSRLVVEAFVDTKLVDVLYVEFRRVIVADAEVRSVMSAEEIVVVANLDVPVTARVPVVVLLIVVKLSMNPVIAWKIEEKKLVEVASPNVDVAEKRLVEVA